jgi:hypothetical protein
MQPSATEKLQELTELFINNNNTAGQDPRQVTIAPEIRIQTVSTIQQITQQIPKHLN